MTDLDPVAQCVADALTKANGYNSTSVHSNVAAFITRRLREAGHIPAPGEQADADQVIMNALAGYIEAELTRELAAESVEGELRERGLLVAPGEIPVPVEALRRVLDPTTPMLEFDHAVADLLARLDSATRTEPGAH